MSSPRLDYSHAVYGAIKVLAASLRDFAILAAREPLSRFTQCSMQNFAVQDGASRYRLYPASSIKERLCLSTWNLELFAERSYWLCNENIRAANGLHGTGARVVRLSAVDQPTSF